MKIARNALPELDYLSQIVLNCTKLKTHRAQLVKSTLSDYHCRQVVTHKDPLDVQLDDDHYIGCIPRISLTRHLDMDLVTQRLKSRFSRVSLPKKFTPVNITGPLNSK